MAYENDPPERTVREREYSFFRRISWGAIFAGFVMAVVINLSLNLLGLGIGIGAIDPMEQDTVPQSLGIGAIIWYLLSIIVSLIAGGWVAARLSGIPERLSGILHGLLTWCLFTIFSFYLLTTAVGSAIGVTGRVAGQALSLAGQGISAVAPEVGDAVQQELGQSGIIQNFKQEARQLAQGALRNPGQMDEAIDKVFSKADSLINEADRETLAKVLAQETGMNEEEARKVADRWANQFEQSRQEFDRLKQEAEQEARTVAEDVSAAVSTAAIAGFIGLLLGALASAAGGAMGRPEEVRRTTYE